MTQKLTLDCKKDFPFFQHHGACVFFDSAVTSLTPKVVIDNINNYYQKYNVSTHSLDYPLAREGTAIVSLCRKVIAKFINSPTAEQIIFCSSTTSALNQLAYSLSFYLEANDEVVLTKAEHSSTLLPFYRLQKTHNIKIRFVNIGIDGIIKISELKKVINEKTKLVLFANMTNNLGTINDPTIITSFIKNYQIAFKPTKKWPFNEILVAVDGAQAVAHCETDLKRWNIDFFTFSGHKLYGPTGIGVWWAKAKWLSIFQPLMLGGGVSTEIDEKGNYSLLNSPHLFEAGTLNMAGIFGLKAAIEYVSSIGFTNIMAHEKALKTYLVQQLETRFGTKIIIYNKNTNNNSIVLFNVKKVFAEEVANFLGKKNICLRSGNFCAKLLPHIIDSTAALRLSLAIYNDKSDVDRLLAALESGFAGKGDFLDDFFT